MRLALSLAAAILIAPAFAADTAPVIDADSRTTIRSIEKRKQELGREYIGLQQQELTILREWNDAHPGWHVDELALTRGLFVVVKDKPAKAAPAKKKKP